MTTTTSQIKSLKSEAINGGDNAMVAICDVALFGQRDEVVQLSAGEAARIDAMTQDEAVAECARVLAESAD